MVFVRVCGCLGVCLCVSGGRGRGGGNVMPSTHMWLVAKVDPPICKKTSMHIDNVEPTSIVQYLYIVHKCVCYQNPLSRGHLTMQSCKFNDPRDLITAGNIHCFVWLMRQCKHNIQHDTITAHSSRMCTSAKALSHIGGVTNPYLAFWPSWLRNAYGTLPDRKRGIGKNKKIEATPRSRIWRYCGCPLSDMYTSWRTVVKWATDSLTTSGFSPNPPRYGHPQM